MCPYVWHLICNFTYVDFMLWGTRDKSTARALEIFTLLWWLQHCGPLSWKRVLVIRDRANLHARPPWNCFRHSSRPINLLSYSQLLMITWVQNSWIFQIWGSGQMASCSSESQWIYFSWLLAVVSCRNSHFRYKCSSPFGLHLPLAQCL